MRIAAVLTSAYAITGHCGRALSSAPKAYIHYCRTKALLCINSHGSFQMLPPCPAVVSSATALGVCLVFSVQGMNAALPYDSIPVHQIRREVPGDCDTLQIISYIDSSFPYNVVVNHVLNKLWPRQHVCNLCHYCICTASHQSSMITLQQAWML